MWLPFLLPIFAFCAVMVMMVAKNNGRSKYGWFCAGALFGPLGFVVAFLPSLKPVTEAQEETPFQVTQSGEISVAEETRQCSACSKEVRVEATECGFCGAAFDPTEIERYVAECRADLKARWENGLKRCPICRNWDVHEAFIEDGSWGDWCPHCARSLKRMK